MNRAKLSAMLALALWGVAGGIVGFVFVQGLLAILAGVPS